MPKFELHVHVEGACDPETYWALAERNGIDLPHDDLASFRRWFDFVDFDHFVEVYVTSVNLLQSPADFRFLVEAFHEYQARHNVVYSEAFLSGTYIAGRPPGHPRPVSPSGRPAAETIVVAGSRGG